MTLGYRTRIYASYVNARNSSLAPASLNALRPRAPYFKRMIRRYFPENRQSAILDLGCGHGALIHFARQTGYANIRGVDASPKQIAVARELGIANVEQGDVLNAVAALADASQDCIVTFDLIEHFTRDELTGLVDEVRRVLKPGGRWIIHAPNGESPFAGRILFGDLTHELAFTRTSIAQVLLSSGFSSVMCYEDAPIPHGLKSSVRWVLWKMIRTLLRLYIAAETGDFGGKHIFTQTFLAVAIR
jgi:2-polyprenyl-3-methyl-5-hydroxy-6-metoxy-1,4-benzoquinol methylase